MSVPEGTGIAIGDHLGAEAFAMLAIALLAVAGAYTVGAAAARPPRKAKGSRTPAASQVGAGMPIVTAWEASVTP